MNKFKKHMAAIVVAVIAIVLVVGQANAEKSGAFLFPRSVSQSPVEQDKRLEHLPGKLSEAVKALRDNDYSTQVSKWEEKDRGNGLSDGQLSASGDAGYPYTDGGFSDCNHIDYYTLKYKRVVKNKKPAVTEVGKEDADKAVASLFVPISKELKPLIENGYLVTRAKVPGAFRTSTELTLVKVTEHDGKKPGEPVYVIERLEIYQAVYDHCSMRHDPGDNMPYPRDPRDPR